MTGFNVVRPEANEVPAAEFEDTRDLVERMFYDHDPNTGELKPLPVMALEGGEDWKRYTDCIPLLKNFAANDPKYTGPLKGKDVVIFGGRRKGRAGTGVELMLAVEDVEKFCGLVKDVVGAIETPEDLPMAA